MDFKTFILKTFNNPDFGSFKHRPAVNYLDDNTTALPSGNSMVVQGNTLKFEDRVLFTALSDSNVNNRIYEVKNKNGVLFLELQLDGQSVSGVPILGDAVFVRQGTYRDTLWSYDADSWVQLKLDFDRDDDVLISGPGDPNSIHIDGSNSPTANIDWGGVDLSNVGDLSANSLTLVSLSGVLKATAGVVSGSADTDDLPEGSNLYFTDERAQDAVGGILTDSASINFTYNDAGNTISADIIDSAIDHGSISGLGDDDHSQYFKVVGRSNESLTLTDTANILWDTDGVGNIGALAANRPNSIYASNKLKVNSITITSPASNAVFVGTEVPLSTGERNTVVGLESGLALTTGTHNTFIGSYTGVATTTGYENTYVGMYSGATATTGFYNAFLGVYSGALNTTGSGNTFIGRAAGFSNTTASDNTCLGNEAGFSNTTGISHTFVGKSAGSSVTTANQNTFIGKSAGTNTTTGSDNTFIGATAGNTNTTGNNNVFVGYQAGFSNTTAIENTMIGQAAGYNNTSSQNTFIGRAAGFANTSGSGNTFVGRTAGTANTTGADNTFVGRDSGLANTTGAANTFFGRGSGASNTTASDNTFLGYFAGTANTTGLSNTFVGRRAGTANTTANENTFVGRDAGLATTTGGANTFIGRDAGLTNTTATQNTFVGSRAGRLNVTGGNNTFIGYSAGTANTTAYDNTFVGCFAGATNTTGGSNTFVGYLAGTSTTTGTDNAFFGRYAGGTNTTGINNTFIGRAAGSTNTTGTSNTFVGRRAGFANTTGVGNTFLGQDAGDTTTSGSSNILIGKESRASSATVSNELVIGSTVNYISQAYLGQGVTNSAPSSVTLQITGASGTDISASAAVFDLAGSRGTGTGDGGEVRIQTAPAGGSGSTLNALSSVSRWTTSGSLRMARSSAAHILWDTDAAGDIGATGANRPNNIYVAGDLVAEVAGKGLKVKEGSNARMGVATLVAGTVTVSNTSVTATTRIFLAHQNNSGTLGFVTVSARNSGSDFTITSSNVADTSDIAWILVEPA